MLRPSANIYSILASATLLLLLAASGEAGSSDLRLPDLRPLTHGLNAYYISVEQGRRLLRFGTLIENAGQGNLELAGRRRDGRMRAWQVIQSGSRRSQKQKSEIGFFEFHPEHFHWHLAQVAEYRLTDLEGTVLSRSEKISFCMVDSRAWDRTNPAIPPYPRYTSCPRGFELKRIVAGLSPGYVDWYHAELPDQHVDITGLPAGAYLLEIEVNPDRILREVDLENNTIRYPVQIP